MIYRIREPFAYNDSRGVPRIAQAGDLVTDRDDAFSRGRLQFMEPIEDVVARSQAPETATAAPGELRSVQKPAKPAPRDAVELDALRAEAEKAGVKVDKRWGADKLRQEITAAKLKNEE